MIKAILIILIRVVVLATIIIAAVASTFWVAIIMLFLFVKLINLSQ